VQSLISEHEEKAQPLDGGEAAKNEFARSMLEEKKRTHRRMKIKSLAESRAVCTKPRSVQRDFCRSKNSLEDKQRDKT